MADSFDEDEDRLMIDDAVFDSAQSVVNSCTTDATTASMTEPGVECEQVDDEPNASFYCGNRPAKTIHGCSRDDRLKVTIKRTHGSINSGGPMNYADEKRPDSKYLSKEDGELDDEEDANTEMHAHSSQKGSTIGHQSSKWSAFQNTGAEAGLGKLRSTGIGQRHFEHIPAYIQPGALNAVKTENITLVGCGKVSAQHGSDEHSSLSIKMNKNQPTDCGAAAIGCGDADSLENDSASLTNKSRKKKQKIIEKNAFYDSSSSEMAIAQQESPYASPSKKQKLNPVNKSTCVKSVQVNENELDLRGSECCLNITVLNRTSNYLYFVTNCNGHELYGILGDGLPPMHHAYMNKKNCGAANAAHSTPPFDMNIAHERLNGSSQFKNRVSTKRTNRSSSVSGPNGFPENKQFANRKGPILMAGRATSASSSDVQSMSGDQNDDESSQSPVSWFNSVNNDPIVALNSISECNEAAQPREFDSCETFSCPIAGCGHRYVAQAQLACHYHTHFVKEDGGRGIYVETMGTQTDKIKMRDAATDPIMPVPVQADQSTDLTDNRAVLQQMKLETGILQRPKLTTTLSNSEEQSISELFKVVTQKADLNTSNFKDESAKSAESRRMNAVASNKVYGTLLSCEGADTQEMSTALDAIRKMVTASGNDSSSTTNVQKHQKQGTAVISDRNTVPSTSNVTVPASHNSAASPAFSDISDDAPTLEKEVSDKADERSTDDVKEEVRNKSPTSSSNKSDKAREAVSVTKISAPNVLCGITTTAPSVATTTRISEATQSSVTEDLRNTTTKRSDFKPIVPNPIPFGAPIVESTAFSAGVRPSSAVASSLPSFGNSPGNPPIFGQPYFMPFIAPPTNSTANSSISMPNSKHKIHDLKNSVPQMKESNSAIQASVVTSPVARPISRSNTGISSNSMQSSQKQTNQQAQTSSLNQMNNSSFTSTSGNQSANDRSVATSQASMNNFIQQQQQQAFLAQMHQQQQHQQMHYMQRMGFPMSQSSMAAHQAYEQMAALHAASFNFPGLFLPPTFPPK